MNNLGLSSSFIAELNLDRYLLNPAVFISPQPESLQECDSSGQTLSTQLPGLQEQHAYCKIMKI